MYTFCVFLYFLRLYIYIYVCVCVCVYRQRNIFHTKKIYKGCAFNKFPDFFFNRHLKLSLTLENSVRYCYTSYKMTDQFLLFQLKWTATEGIRIHPDCHIWWISKKQSEREDTLEERYAIKFCFKLGKKCHRNVLNASHCFWTILHESSFSFWVA